MAKKVKAVVKIQVEAGKATAAPPVGPALGQHGITMMAFIKEYNERTAKFDTTVEAHCRLGVDPKQADQLVRGTAILPHGTGKKIRVAVFATGDKAREAEAAGADVVGADDLSKRIEGGWMDFDIAVATP